jgi:NAD(P)-dependent dehydrogenase (short-subunit alcohol dehydrogenase family)
MGTHDGRVCLVTGAGRGIGREHALLLAREGAHVIVNDVGPVGGETAARTNPARDVVEEIVASGGSAVASTHPVNEWDSARRIVEEAVEAFRDLHVVVNNAGILRDRTLVTMSEDEFDDVISVHLKGAFNITRWAANYWRDQHKKGASQSRAVVNTSSGAGLHGNAGQTNYAAAKAGIAAMTLVHAAELSRYHVRVNCIAPIARTRLTLATPGAEELMADPMFDPANISPLVAWLAAEQCPFNGQVFSVFGGSVGIYAGWSVAQEVTSTTRWTVQELATAMNTLPRQVETVNQTAIAFRTMS